MKKCLLTFILLLKIVICFATDYYFSAAGSTGNNGLTPGTSWPLSKVTSATFVAGDRLLFNKGDTFTGTATLTHSGASGNPIILDLYGAAAHNAVLDGGGSSSAPVLKISANYITVNNLVIQNGQNAQGVVNITTGIHDVTLFNCYINHGIRGVNAVGAGSGGVANLHILHCWFTAIADGNSHPNGGGSHVQLNNCNGSGMEIAFCNSYEDISVSTLGVGDIYSLYQCNGTVSSLIAVHDNNVRGGSNNTSGYAGTIGGDVGGSNQHIYNNIYLESGCAGIQLQGGTNIIAENNQAYSVGHTYNYAGIEYANFSGTNMSGNTVQNNILNWTGSGLVTTGNTHTPSAGQSGSFANGSSGAALALPTGWSSNTPNGSHGAVTNSSLPNPLWTGTPWDTPSTPVAPLISYSPNIDVYTTGVAISSLSPIISGSTPTSYSVNTAFPTGISLNTTTGVISGTPTVTSATSSYVVTGTNGTGSDTARLTMTVNAAVVAPSLSYSPTSNTYIVGTAITTWSLSNSGGAITGLYSISPSLPAGLNFNTSTGAITGTPTAASSSTVYTVSGTNSAGTSSPTITITVNNTGILTVIKRKIIII